MRMMRHLAPAAASGAAICWLVVNAGTHFVRPSQVGWLLSRDWAAGYLGWAFFRTAPWGWPLGQNPAYPFPTGSTLAYSDGIPVIAVALKPLAPILPVDFQFIGLWLVACFALQGFFGARLTALATTSRLQQILGGALFALAPPLLHRVLAPNTGHASLCGHWVVLGFLWIAVAPGGAGPRGVRKTFALAAGLLVFASGVHPYLVIMGLAFTAAALARMAFVDRVLRARAAAAALALLVALAAAGMIAFGFLATAARSGAEGFGWFSADLLSLVAPMGWSRLWTGPPVGDGQYEGFGYLGAGGLLLVVLAVPLATRIPRRTVALAAPAAAAATFLGLFALSNRITFAGSPVLTLRWDELVPPIVAALRSSGRFIWALHYALLFGAIAVVVVALRARPHIATAALAAAVALQVIDVRPPANAQLPSSDRRSSSPAWAHATGLYQHVVMYPPVLIDGSGAVAPESCGGLFWNGYAWLGTIAARIGATYNSAYLARADPAIAAACETRRAELLRGELEPATIYVPHPSALAMFVAAGATCGALDGIPVCVSGDRRTAFRDLLAETPIRHVAPAPRP
jgi:hypothetical protein